MSRGVDVFDNIYVGHFDCVLEVISVWPDFVKYADKLKRIRNDIKERWRKAYDVNPNHFNSLSHDDIFCPNIMLKFSNQFNEIAFENVALIDFQFAFRASPTTDLYFFLNTSVNESFRPHCFDELVEFYHGHLAQFLEKLEYKNHIPTWPEFREQYQGRRFLGKYFQVLFEKLVKTEFIDNFLN